MAEEAILAKSGEDIQRKKEKDLRGSQYRLGTEIAHEIEGEACSHIQIGIKIERIIVNLSIVWRGGQ